MDPHSINGPEAEIDKPTAGRDMMERWTDSINKKTEETCIKMRYVTDSLLGIFIEALDNTVNNLFDKY